MKDGIEMRIYNINSLGMKLGLMLKFKLKNIKFNLGEMMNWIKLDN